MLKDCEGNRIYLSQNPNSHLLILGGSGYGKTYFLCRQMEEDLSKGGRIFLVDYSGSYTEAELQKNGFRFLNKVNFFNPKETGLEWPFPEKILPSALIDTLNNVLNIKSYYQKKLLTYGIELVLSNNRIFSIPLLKCQFESLLSENDDTEDKKNILHLLTKIEPYSPLHEIHFSCKKDMDGNNKSPSIIILQLSDYPEIHRKFLVEFFAEMFWITTRFGEKDAGIIILDEFQNLNLSPGKALSSMLREGRKFGLSVYLSSQFIGGYDNEAVSTLMQAANKFFFHPCGNDLKSIANLIDPNSPNEWKVILKNLHRGEAVLSGSFCIGGRKKEIHTPVICKISKCSSTSLFVNNDANIEEY